MTAWGTSNEGHYRPRYQEIREKLAARWKALFGANRPTTDDTIDGHIVSLVAYIEDDLREADEGTYNSGYLSTAGGVCLDQVVALVHARKRATSSTVTLTLGGTPSTVIPAGSLVEVNDTSERFAIDAEATIGGGGTVSATATAANTGPVAAGAGTTWNIVTPVTGWSTVTNAADATLGQNEETDPELRTRTRTATQVGGVAAAVAALDGVTAVGYLENDTDYTDANGLPPHSIELVVTGGDDQEIAETIYAHRPDGIATYGSTSKTVQDVNGSNKTIKLTRPTSVTLHVAVQVTAGEGFPSTGTPSADILAAVVAWGATLAGGDDASPFQCAGAIAAAVPGIATATVKIDDVDPPVDTGAYAINERQIASIVEANVDVTVS